MIRTYTFSAAGGHAVNEDAFALRPVPGAEGAWLVALADGQGGRAGGARAAQLACRVALESAAQEAEPDWPTVLASADAAVTTDPEAGLATLVGLRVHGGRVTGASCGNSAAVVVCGASAPRVLTAYQHKNPPVGSGDAAFVPFAMKLTAPWKLLAITDGVWKYAGWDRVWDSAARLSGVELLADLQLAAQLPTTGTFPDDFTVVLLESE